MARKNEIKKIENTKKCKAAFVKRYSSLLKKAKEIAICCDVDILFVAFSPAKRLNKFCSQNRIEDMLQCFIKLPNLELQIKKSTLELQIVDANLRDYVPRPEQVSSLHQLSWCESNLQQSLQKVMARKMKLEKQEKMDVHFAAQQTTPQQFETNNWVNPYSTSIPRSIYQDWMNKEKRVANSFSNYTYTPSFGSSSQSENIPFLQVQNSSPHIPFQQQNMVVDVQKNSTQTFGQSQSQQQNMVVDFQYNPTQTFGQPQAQVTLGESSDNSLISFRIGDRNPFKLGLENVHSNCNNNINNNYNNNHIIQPNDPSSIQSEAITPNVHGFNNSMEENIMENSEYFVETTHENDACKWDDIEAFLNEALNEEDFRNLD
ncbi:hypothetical protein H5410_047848 [Solanum commersonii]|uniref:MADS-box domain-containing protein n=1 Tax=Solanum commersonii TaxID=4109 RepID=A0A9J5XJW9_SOLCO|nr:hypothetical protein H5410_047848 [Solanum commersonii]